MIIYLIIYYSFNTTFDEILSPFSALQIISPRNIFPACAPSIHVFVGVKVTLKFH